MSAVKRRKQKLGAGDRAFNIVLGGLTTVSVVVILYPLIFVLVASISDPMEIFQGNVWLWPKGFNLEAYKQVFRNGDIFTGYKNTLIYTVVGTLVTIIITFSAAYPLSRKKLYGRSKLMGFFLFTMFFSGGMIPTYLMVKNLGLYNTMWAVILVGTVSVYNIIVARTFMQNTIPEELYEAASMDGCGDIRVFFKMVLPLSAPILAVLVLFYGVNFWNSYFNGLIYLSERSAYPLQMFLREILLNNMADSMIDTAGMDISKFMVGESIKYAVIIVSSVPIFTKIEMHATLCIEAAAAGKHIFSQKPFAYNIEEGRKIIRAVDEAGVKLTPSFMHSYMDGSIVARRIVEEGKIGEIRHIRMRNATKNPFDSAPGYGGCMMDIGCHGMDLIHTVAGSSIEDVFALHLSPRDEKRREEFGERANLNGVENTAILNYRLASGATVFHEVFWTQVAQTNRFEMEIYGAKGVIYLYNPHRSDIVYYGWNLDGHPRKDIHWQAAPVDPQFFGYIHHKTFVDDLLNGTNNSKTARDAFVPLQVVEAARRSFESGRIERVLGI